MSRLPMLLAVAALAAPAAATAQESVKLTKSEIKDMQSALGVTADGEIGPQTRRALKRYERSQGFVADGKPDAEVLDALGVEYGEDDYASEASSTPAVDAARSVIGSPYASGGTDPSGFDCSGLVQWAFKRAGTKLPRDSFSQYGEGESISRSEIEAGDLVFFSTAGSGASHAAIAVSNTRVISATSSRGVTEHTRRGDYWGAHYVGARRIS